VRKGSTDQEDDAAKMSSNALASSNTGAHHRPAVTGLSSDEGRSADRRLASVIRDFVLGISPRHISATGGTTEGGCITT
jgi:hypothetical protein